MTTVTVLDGGLPKWKREGRAVESGPATAASRNSSPPFPSRRMVRDFDAVMGIVEDEAPRWWMPAAPAASRREEPEPRAGLRGGHMPGAVNVPLPQADRRRRHAESRRTSCEPLFAEQASICAAPIVTTCGSGITAAILMLALERSARATSRSMTAPGRNGAAAPSPGGDRTDERRRNGSAASP